MTTTVNPKGESTLTSVSKPSRASPSGLAGQASMLGPLVEHATESRCASALPESIFFVRLYFTFCFGEALLDAQFGPLSGRTTLVQRSPRIDPACCRWGSGMSFGSSVAPAPPLMAALTTFACSQPNGHMASSGYRGCLAALGDCSGKDSLVIGTAYQQNAASTLFTGFRTCS